jgi:two-component system NtrC family sensor kinase
MSSTDRARILIVDDNAAIHDDFTKILAPQPAQATALDDYEAEMLGTAPATPAAELELAHVNQGKDALTMVTAACGQARPFAVAFVDMRMPPGWDGLETIERIWAVDPTVQVVICSAYSDYTWADYRARLGMRDSLLILRKPFDPIEVIQIAHALAAKWTVTRELRSRIEEVGAVNARLAGELRTHARTRKLETIGRLVSSIAHEIATPIQSIGMNLETVDEGSPEAHEALAAMRSGVDRIAKLVRAMRDLSHPGHSEPRPADLQRALGCAIEVAAGAYRHVAEVVTDFKAIPKVVCHVDQLHQVFLNLIVNASHAMQGQARRGTLTITARQECDDVVISIADTGTGIPQEIRDRVFEPFFTTKDVGEGTGQGLAIVKTIVEDHHRGELSFETAVGVGTTFHVRLPIAGMPSRPSLPQIAA